MTEIKDKISSCFLKQSNAPLVVFRLLFGALMVFSTFRFYWKGWIDELYLKPDFHFKYSGFEWVQVLPEDWFYALYFIIGLSAFMIAVGFFYRAATICFFATFTYVELIDKTYYLNHYYFVSLIALLLIFLPAHQRFSIDVKLGITQFSKTCARWHVGIIKFQLAIVYFFAGISKIHPDWLLRAEPLQNWLHTNHHLPIIGQWLKTTWFAFVMSWCGMLYDILIPFFLMKKRTRAYAYLIVVLFHVFTWILFPIGVFPWVMMASTLIFFSSNWHENILQWMSKSDGLQPKFQNKSNKGWAPAFLSVFVLFQLLFPMRYLMYDGDLFWKEQGYRFSWRVMLMEKAGHANFYVKDSNTGRMIEIDNSDFLTPNQEKMMATQPDMILNYANYLQDQFSDSTLSVKGKSYQIRNPTVHADVFVSLNGSGSKPFVSKEVNLTAVKNDFSERNWVENFND